MRTLTVKDTDGHPYYFVGATLYDCERERDKHTAKAEAAGCKLREVPVLGSTDEGPYSPRFKIKRGPGGVIVAIEWCGPSRWT